MGVSALSLLLAHHASQAAARAPTSGSGVGGSQWGAPSPSSSYGGTRPPYGPSDGSGSGGGGGNGGGYGMYDYDYEYDGQGPRAGGSGMGGRRQQPGSGSVLNDPSMGGRGRQPLDARRRATQRAGARGALIDWLID